MLPSLSNFAWFPSQTTPNVYNAVGKRQKRLSCMNRGWRWVFVGIALLGSGPASADEAVTHQGRIFVGSLKKNEFIVSGFQQVLPLVQIHHVRFPENPAPLPRCRMHHQLLLGGGQKLVGELRSISVSEIAFRLATGQNVKLPRRRVQGIVQADGYLLQLADDFDKDNGSLQWANKPSFDAEHVFSGKRSLLMNAGSKDLEARLPRSDLNNWRATLYFFDKSAAATIRFRLQSEQGDASLTLTLGGKRYHADCADGIPLNATIGWHILQLDAARGEAKVFVDDFFLGRKTIPRNASLVSMRFSHTGAGALWLDAFSLTNRTPPPTRTPGPPDLDEVWLASGDQVFGQITSADEHAIGFTARYGKRTFPWKSVRGIFFGKQPRSTDQGATVRFRSGPGVTADSLDGIIIDVNERRMVLRHAVLGDVTIARDRLDTVRMR